MYNYFIQTKKKIHKHPTKMQWMECDQFVAFLQEVRSKDSSSFIKSWRARPKKGKKNVAGQ
jgi:hypothetical protein